MSHIKMTDEEDALQRCITEFMLDTCRYTNVGPRAFAACMSRAAIRAGCGDTNELFSSGSFAEFYIKPMLSCVGDIDIMFCYRSCLAIPAGYIPPTEFLPGKFQRTVAVCEIIDSHQPGFVYLKPSYVLNRDDNGRVITVKKTAESGGMPAFMPRPDDNQDFANMAVHPYALQLQLLLPFCRKQNINLGLLYHSELRNLFSADAHGPTTAFAADINSGKFDNTLFTLDYVDCVRCLVWPPLASDWPKRLRIHGVPDLSTINLVVNDGCDLVAAVHPLCRQDEWMNKHQWRLSFSRAEVVLLNSWTPVQQIVYHMLRFIIKREVLSKTKNGDSALPHLSNYHIKTLMLWESEQKPQRWWSAESSLIELCSSLLHKLSDCVTKKHCPQYFIGDCNLLDHFVEDASLKICSNLTNLADSSVLLRWFVNNYICECVQLCPDEVSALFVSTWSSDTLTKAVHVLTDWKLNCLPQERCMEHFEHASLVMPCFLQVCHIFGDKQRIILMKEFQNFDQGTRDFNTAISILHVACSVANRSLTEDLLELLWMLFHPVTAKANGTTTNKFECISKAIALATLSNGNNSVLEMLHNEMSKAYLHQSFAYEQESTYCTVHVLLAALYYKSGHYQTALDHCRQAFVESGGEQFGPRSIGAEYLPQIDENVDNVFGLIQLYQQVQKESLNDDRKSQAHAVSVPAFSTQLIARYLYTKCFTVAIGKGDTMKLYREQLLSKTHLPLLSDVLLFKTMKIQLQGECTETSVGKDTNGGTRNSASSSMDTTLLVTTLELVALDKLSTVRRELHCEQFPVANEFEALYAYKCGLFEECMQLCRSNIDILLRDDCFATIRGSGLAHRLWPVPEMLSLLDGELLSVFGITQLVCPLSMTEMIDYSIGVPTLLLYLLVRCHENGCSGSFDDTLNLIRFVHHVTFQAQPEVFAFDRLILKLIYRLLKLYIKTRNYLQP